MNELSPTVVPARHHLLSALLGLREEQPNPCLIDAPTPGHQVQSGGTQHIHLFRTWNWRPADGPRLSRALGV